MAERWEKDLKNYARLVSKGKITDTVQMEAEFNHFQNLLVRDEEEMTFDEADDVIKDLSEIWKKISDKTDLPFYYDNVAEREGWL